MAYQTYMSIVASFILATISLYIGVTLDNVQSEMTISVSTETLYNLVRIGAIISALKNNILLPNPRTSLFVTSPNLRSFF